MEQNVQEQLYSFIVSNLPKETLQQIEENIVLKYGVVENFLDDELKVTPKGRLRPQMRRYLIDEAFCASGGEVRHTTPRGEHYIVSDFGDIILSHVEVPSGAKVRNAVHRKMLAQKNAILEPLQIDMFDDPKAEFSGKLHVVVIVTQPGQRDEQRVPASIDVAIPFSNWKGYHVWLSLGELLDMYESEELHESDMAWPTLRVALEEKETKTSGE